MYFSSGGVKLAFGRDLFLFAAVIANTIVGTSGNSKEISGRSFHSIYLFYVRSCGPK